MTMLARFAAAGLALAATAPAAAADLSLTFLGQQTLPFNASFAGTPVGGLSGVDFDPVSGRYIAISDDRSQNAPARFYDLDFQVSSSGFTGVSVTGVTTLKQPDGSLYPALAVDGESIRFAGAGKFVYSSEGDANRFLPPFVREGNLADGSFSNDYVLPGYYTPTADAGIRNNLALESLTFSTDGTQLVTATESALKQDGPIASLTNGANTRILVLGADSRAPLAEYVYVTDAIPTAPVPGGSADNGLVELLAYAPGKYIAMERAFAAGVGNSVRLYTIDLTGATNVLAEGDLDAVAYTPVTKTLLLDLATLGIRPDNIEALTFGETLDNGKRSLFLVSDNNFSSGQIQQFLAFQVDVAAVPEPATWATMIGGMGVVGGSLRRRRTAAVAAA